MGAVNKKKKSKKVLRRKSTPTRVPAAYLVIMAGGTGTRFWPKSTLRKPKQLLSFGNDNRVLLRQTLDRFDGIIPENQRIIVTTEALKKEIKKVSGKVKILSEPQGRNTAPCVYWAAREIARENPEALMLVMPADHYIKDEKRYQKVIAQAMRRAQRGQELITLGIKPTHAETGFGYLKAGPADSEGAYRVEGFFEKPEQSTAESYLRSGNFFWNAGMFVWRVDLILRHFDSLMPEMKQAWEKARGKVATAYPQMTATSVDFGIMEKIKDGIITYPLDVGWNDLGNWLSMENLLGKNEDGCTVASGRLVVVDSRNNIVDVPDTLVALIGCENLIVVEHNGSLLICPKEHAQKIRTVTELVRKSFPDRA